MEEASHMISSGLESDKDSPLYQVIKKTLPMNS